MAIPHGLHRLRKLPDGRVVSVAQHLVSPGDLWNIQQLAPPGMGWPAALGEAFFGESVGASRGHLLTYDGVADRCGLVDEDLRRVVIAAGNAAEPTVESSCAFGNILTEAMAEQARRHER